MSRRMISWGSKATGRNKLATITETQVALNHEPLFRDVDIHHYDDDPDGEGAWLYSTTEERMFRPALEGSTIVTTLNRNGVVRLYGVQGPGSTAPVAGSAVRYGHE